MSMETLARRYSTPSSPTSSSTTMSTVVLTVVAPQDVVLLAKDASVMTWALFWMSVASEYAA